MADETPVHVGENSPEFVAYKLYETIADNEHKTLTSSMVGEATADRAWVLSTYAECLRTVRRAHYSPDK